MTTSRLNKIPYILTSHGMLSEYHLNEKKKYLKKLWLSFVDKKNIDQVSALHVTALSEEIELKRLLPDLRFKNIPLGLTMPNISVKNKVKHGNLNLLFISRLNNKKNIPAILEAVLKATQKGISLNLKIAGEANPGDEDYKKYLQNIVQDLKIQEHVEFCGFLSGQAKEEVFQWADVFLLPSFYENFGVAVLEALSYSVPVIISPQVALSKEVKEFGGGWVTDEAHPQSPDSILKILELINQDRKLILEESIKARQVAERFSWENNAKALVSLYESILSKK
jgi:glycosyltransferase involved in cell wall biosynthesis